MKDKVIILFTRIPTLGRTKTRLEPFLSKELCVELQRAFIEDIYNNIKNMGIDIIVSYTNHGDIKILKEIFKDNVYYLEQVGDDLGEKMYNAISFSLERYKKSVLIGSDLPLIGEKDIRKAFDILNEKDIAISSTLDGGYYLIGMKERYKEIFNIVYSTNSVFKETVEKIKAINKTYGIGNIQLDIDDKEDFFKLYNILKEDENIPCGNTRDLVNSIVEKSGLDG